jgi:hypothetical protein
MVKAIAITRLDRSASELRELAVRTEDSGVVRRLLAIALLLDGWPRGEAATANGMGSSDAVRLGASLQCGRCRQPDDQPALWAHAGIE